MAEEEKSKVPKNQNVEKAMADDAQASTTKIADETSEDNRTGELETFLPDRHALNLPAEQAGYKLETNTMEVHHHPHVEKKNFKEYLLEGLMIFVAVLLGFIAENVREMITEHERAEVFAASMLRDLQTDTAELNSYRTYMNFAASKADTLIQLLSANELQNIETGKLYWYGLFGGARRLFVPDDATFQQMKSSGALRYFSHGLAEQAAQYDQYCRKWTAFEDLNIDVYVEVRKARAHIFNFRYNAIANNLALSNSNFSLINQQRVDSFLHSNPPLLSSDKTNFNEYVELVRSRFMHTSAGYADTTYARAIKLIQVLKKEYKLNDE